jgi:putative effector of murein hydrolase
MAIDHIFVSELLVLVMLYLLYALLSLDTYCENDTCMEVLCVSFLIVVTLTMTHTQFEDFNKMQQQNLLKSVETKLVF